MDKRSTPAAPPASTPQTEGTTVGIGTWGNLLHLSSLSYGGASGKVPSSGLRVCEVLLEKREGAAAGVLPNLAREAVADAGINLQIVRDISLFQHFLQMMRLFDRYSGISVTVQDQHRAKPAHEEFHFFGKPSKVLHHRLDARIDRRNRERKVGPQRKSEQADAIRVDDFLALDMADGVPKRFPPKREVPHGGLFVDHFLGPGAVEVMQNVDGEALCRQHACGIRHRSVAASRAVQSDNGGKAMAVT